MAEALQSILDEDQRVKTQDQLAKLIGKDKTWVSGMLRILTLPAALQQKVGSTQLTVSYDAMIRIARLENPKHQEPLIEQSLSGATQKEIREQIDRRKGNVKSPDSNKSSKPKKVFHTTQHASVIIQSENSRGLSGNRMMAALHEALQAARKQSGD
ncbi:MAG: hypothetical protein M3O30_13025 [Planctomycetota bacterium]|nr:hypothetical protein [Planctomycetota bacterium]